MCPTIIKLVISQRFESWHLHSGC